jgi:prepilin-type N-terminal cleavage/methylation domain-containing protein
MKITLVTVVPVPQGSARRGGNAGFTLVELVIAMTVFLVIGGTAMTLFRRHVSQFNDQQGQVGLNTSLRNALTQMEVDVANAGTGYFTTVDKASFPIGVTIASGGSAVACNAGQTYPAACFDQLNIISTDSSTPPGRPDDGTQVGCTNTKATPAFVIPPAVINPATGANWTVAGYAAKFNVGDQILWANGLSYNTAYVTGPATVAGPDISIPHRLTSADFTANSGGALGTDPLGISTVNDASLVTSFCYNTGTVVKLAPPVIYGVDTATNPANPVLFRRVGAGAQTPIADQIIGFRLVTTLANCPLAMTDWPAPPAVPACNGNPTNFNQIRTVQISLIGRTTPGANSADSFHNTFDLGPYRIEAVSVTASPRNLSMND